MVTAAATLGRRPARAPRRVSILGATGSVGSSTLDLIERNTELYDVVALTANTDAAGLAESAIRHGAELAVIGDPDRYSILKELLAGTGIEAAAGEAALSDAARRPADWVMAAIIGAAGLRPTFEAVAQGTHVALANKECLVSAGNVFLDAVNRSGAVLLPVDSEHSAIFQAIDDTQGDALERITLTASGGPFRTWSAERMAGATPEDALKHPNWSMGQKITIDSATLMNKGLELIEAYYLFPVDADQLDIVIHPQSIIHCLVEYADGAVLAQMSAPDMRTPIAYSLAYPNRMSAPTERLDLTALKQLTFEAPDMVRFPALGLARQALEAGAKATTILNAANEVAVEAFLGKRIGFLSICGLVEAALESGPASREDDPASLDDILALDKIGRDLATKLLPRFTLT